MYGDEAGALDAYMREVVRSEIDATASEIDALLATENDGDLDDFVHRHSCYYHEGDGYSGRAWLDKIRTWLRTPDRAS
jgi:hypothetical protein